MEPSIPSKRMLQASKKNANLLCYLDQLNRAVTVQLRTLQSHRADLQSC